MRKYIKLCDADVILLTEFIENDLNPSLPVPITKKMVVDVISEYARKLIERADGYICVENERYLGIIAGYIRNRIENKHVYISLIGCSPWIRGEGLGTELMRRFIEDIPTNCQIEIRTNTDEDNQSAQNFYIKQGFRVLGIEEDVSGTKRVSLVKYI